MENNMITKEQELNKIQVELEELHSQYHTEYQNLSKQIEKEIKYLLDEKVKISVSTLRYHSIWFTISLLLDEGKTSGRYSINCGWEDDSRFFSKKESNEEPLLKFNICASGDFDRTSKDQLRFIKLLSRLTDYFKVIENNLLNLDLSKLMEIEDKLAVLYNKKEEINLYYKRLELQKIEDKLKPGVKIVDKKQTNIIYTITRITPKRLYVDVRDSNMPSIIFNMPSVVLDVRQFNKDEIIIKLKDGRFEFKED